MYYKDIYTMTKLVSLRIDEEALKALDEHMKGFRYWKRHGVMVHLLENLLLYADTKTLYTIASPHSTRRSTSIR